MTTVDVRRLTKIYRGVRVVDNVNFTLEPGHVTAFLGPNGAGKSTTMKMMTGLTTPTTGTVTYDGVAYRSLAAPMSSVGAMIDAGAVDGSRCAIDHLRAISFSNELPTSHAMETLERAGLTSVAKVRIGGFSPGMRQRLGIATALLGSPDVLILDEPFNGPDPDGIRWLRACLRTLADEGCTVLVSSHLVGEISQIADRLVIIGRGRILADTTVSGFLSEHTQLSCRPARHRHHGARDRHHGVRHRPDPDLPDNNSAPNHSFHRKGSLGDRTGTLRRSVPVGRHVPARTGNTLRARTSLCGALYITAIATLSIALGFHMRSTAGAITVLVALILLVPALGGIVPPGLDVLLSYWPTQAPTAVLTTVPDPEVPRPWWNLTVMCAGVFAMLGIAASAFTKCDI